MEISTVPTWIWGGAFAVALICLVVYADHAQRKEDSERDKKAKDDAQRSTDLEVAETSSTALEPIDAEEKPIEVPVNVAIFKYQKSETVKAYFDNVRVYTTAKKSHFEAGSRGVSVRVMKGVSFRFGNSCGRMVSREINVCLGSGPVAVTNKHIYFATGSATKRIPFTKIVSINTTNYGVKILKDGERAKPVELCFESQTDLQKFMKNVIQTEA